MIQLYLTMYVITMSGDRYDPLAFRRCPTYRRDHFQKHQKSVEQGIFGVYQDVLHVHIIALVERDIYYVEHGCTMKAKTARTYVTV